MKLHLGCGQRYLKGYINIDFPISEHTVQEKSVADYYADIVGLRYLSSSIDEIRLHHVFEHFTRPIACALIASWRSWLKPKGILHIEVPDFRRQIISYLNPFTTRRQKMLGIRHLFGSHEAAWAIHCEGYSINELTYILKSFGFFGLKQETNSWRGTHNLEVIAYKGSKEFSQQECFQIAREVLSNYLLDSTELPLLEIWMNIYHEQVQKSWCMYE